MIEHTETCRHFVDRYLGRASLPAFLVVADALGCWIFLLPILILAQRLDMPRNADL